MAKAYSYIRFSTPEQSKGNSRQRQNDKALEYAEQHGLDLDTVLTFEDLGKSAYRSGNSATGMLGEFIKGIDSGLVEKDSTLIVESLDRLTRDQIFEAQSLVMQILSKGLTIVTLIDGKSLSRDICNREPFRLLETIMILFRANDESETKSYRGLDNWKVKRNKAEQENKPLSRVVVGWVKANEDRTALEIIPERAEIVQGIYRDFLSGVGAETIASKLNKEGVDTWGEGKKKAKMWGKSYVTKILKNPAVTGELTLHTLERSATKKQRIPQQTLTDYYPAVIDNITFQRVQELQEGKGIKGRKVSQEVKNILSYLGRCPVCGGTMTRTNKGNNQYLVCVKAKGKAGCVYRTAPYGKIETAILNSVPLMLPAIKTDSPERSAVRLKIAKLEKDTEQRRTEINRLIGLVKSGEATENDVAWQDEDPEGVTFRTVREEIQTLEKFIYVSTRQIEHLEKVSARSNPKITDEKFQALLSAIKAGSSMAEINAGLRAIFSKAVIDYDQKMVLLQFKYREAVLPVAWE